MTRFVSLATDANPTYAIYAPIVTRIWQQLGYQPILFVHDGHGHAPERGVYGWETPFGDHVRASLPVPPVIVPRVEPLSPGNTMRCVRLVAASLPHVSAQDLVLTADIDMAPLSKTFFERPAWPPFVLRADMYGPFEGASSLRGPDGAPALLCGHWRFPLCYMGLPAVVWEELLPLVQGDPVLSLRRVLHGLRQDNIEYDESTISARLLLSRYAVGTLEHIRSSEEQGDLWRQGELELVGVADWARRDGWPKKMLIHGEGQVYNEVTRSAFDWHMPRPSAPWVGGALAKFWPELADFILPYWEKVATLTRLTS